MKASVIRATAFRALKPRLFEPIIPLKLIEGLKEKYSFHQVPNVIDQSATSAPAMFHLGELKKGDHVIEVEQLLIAYIGLEATSIGVATRSSTDDCDEFLENLLDWAKETYKLDTTPIHPNAYHSALEAVLAKEIGRPFEQLNLIGKAISSLLSAYGSKGSNFELTGFTMHIDLTKNPPPPIPTPFNIERRLGAKFEENKYFSQAPLKTGDHKAVLEQLEKILLS